MFSQPYRSPQHFPGETMQKTLILLFVLVLAIAPAPARALGLPNTPTGFPPEAALGQTYYVDPSGSDTTGDGSQGHPWASLRHAAGQVEAGATVLINPGTYGGGIVVETGGTAAEPVTFRASGPGVIVEGSGGERDAFFIDRASWVVVEGLTIRHATRAGLRISQANHVTVRNSTFADNGTWGLFTDFSDYTTVEDSEAYGSGDEHGIYISNSSDYPTIRRNRLHHNHACGLHMNGDISMGGDGIISHALVEGNIIYANGLGGGSGINMDGVTDSLVRNNLLYDNHAGGITLYQIDGGSGSQNNLILNNTVLMAADGRWAINLPDASSTHNKLFNNILYTYHSYRGSIAIAAPALAGFESDYNVVMERFTTDDGDSVLSLAEWQALGYDAHALVAAPGQLFVNPAAHDYHLKAGSPAIDRGLALSQVAEDLEGHPRPAGAGYDIGAYEFTLALALHAAPGDRQISLRWTVNTPLPAGATWRIRYTGPVGDQPSPIGGIPASTRAFTLTGLENYTRYTITLEAVQGGAVLLSATAQAVPTDRIIYLPGLEGGR
jgi:parallel beta-helix repeat protein